MFDVNHLPSRQDGQDAFPHLGMRGRPRKFPIIFSQLQRFSDDGLVDVDLKVHRFRRTLGPLSNFACRLSIPFRVVLQVVDG
jgi:hypothetical protein